MHKRSFVKTAIAGSLMNAWVPPAVVAISLPAHAQTSCNDIRWIPGFPPASTLCFSNEMFTNVQLLLFSDTQGNENSSFTGDVLEVHSDNPAHQVTWTLAANSLNIRVTEIVSQGCVDGTVVLTQENDFSPGLLFIETSCGTITMPFGP